MLNTTLVVVSKQPKSSLKIQNKKPSVKQPRSNSRPKTAFRGRSEMFNSTTPIKFLSNLEESIRGSVSRGAKGPKSKGANGAKDHLANSQVIIISGKQQSNINVKSGSKHATLNNTIYMTNQSVVDSKAKNEKDLGGTQTLLQTTQSDMKINTLKKQIHEIVRASETSQQSSKIKLRL